MAMALGQGKVEATVQITTLVTSNWLVTLLILALSWAGNARDWTLIASLMGTQVIVRGDRINRLSTTDAARFLWYTCGYLLRS